VDIVCNGNGTIIGCSITGDNFMDLSPDFDYLLHISEVHACLRLSVASFTH